MHLLIDGDIIARKLSYVFENKTDKEAFVAIDDYLGHLYDYFYEYFQFPTKSDDQTIFLGGEGSFRKELDPTYKANRKDKADPKHLDAIEEYLISKHNAKRTKGGFETDDALSFLQTKSTAKTTCIASIDKDLLQVPGYHYNLDNQTLTYVTPFQGLKSFFTQMLVGDTADNVTGIEGVGPVGAKKILSGCVSEQQLFEAVQGQYNDDARMLKNSHLLWLKQAHFKNPVEARIETVPAKA